MSLSKHALLFFGFNFINCHFLSLFLAFPGYIKKYSFSLSVTKYVDVGLDGKNGTAANRSFLDLIPYISKTPFNGTFRHHPKTARVNDSIGRSEGKTDLQVIKMNSVPVVGVSVIKFAVNK